MYPLDLISAQFGHMYCYCHIKPVCQVVQEAEISMSTRTIEQYSPADSPKSCNVSNSITNVKPSRKFIPIFNFNFMRRFTSRATGCQWWSTKSSISNLCGSIKALELSAWRNNTEQVVIWRVQVTQKSSFRQAGKNSTRELVSRQVQRLQQFQLTNLLRDCSV